MPRALASVGRFLARWPLHSAFFAIDLVLLYVSADVSVTEISTILWVIALLFGFAALFVALFVAATGRLNRAAIGATTMLFLVFFVPLVLGAPETVSQGGRIAALGAIILVAIAMAFCLRHISRDARFVTLAFNVIVIGFSVSPMTHALVMASDLSGRRPGPAELFPDISASASDTSPDVWHLVFDRYAGLETLRQVYGFDNEPFLKQLEQRGFSVARDAASNYQRTAPSLGSGLDLDYLTPLHAFGQIAGYDEIPLYRALQDNRVSRFFATQGYRVVNAGPWWESTRHNGNETESLNYDDMPELVRTMLERSLFGYFAVTSGIEFGNGRLSQCRRIRYQLDRLDAAAQSVDRKFVFAHILLPHPPFVVDADGRCKTAAQAARLSRVDNYVAQVKYANARILQLIDRIEAGPRPAVILLQSDEGPWPAAFAGNELSRGTDAAEIDWTALSAAQIREKMLILYAIRVSDGNPIPLDPHATPVNAYRWIFNRFFGGQFGLLPERSYIFKDRLHLYDFIDVTGKLR